MLRHELHILILVVCQFLGFRHVWITCITKQPKRSWQHMDHARCKMRGRLEMGLKPRSSMDCCKRIALDAASPAGYRSCIAVVLILGLLSSNVRLPLRGSFVSYLLISNTVFFSLRLPALRLTMGVSLSAVIRYGASIS